MAEAVERHARATDPHEAAEEELRLRAQANRVASDLHAREAASLDAQTRGIGGRGRGAPGHAYEQPAYEQPAYQQPGYGDGRPIYEDERGSAVYEDGTPVHTDGRAVYEDGTPIQRDDQPVYEDEHGRPVYEDDRPRY